MHNIASVYPELTKSEKKIADFITGNAYDAQYMSITSLAEECNVADATISRFCKALGYQGYNDFKIALAKHVGTKVDEIDNDAAVGKINLDDSLKDVAKKLYSVETTAIKQSFELLNEQDLSEAVKHLHNANRVYCFGQGGSSVIAKEAWARFIVATPQFQCIEDSHMQVMAASLCTKDDVIMFFSYSGSTKDSIDVLTPAKKHGAKIILITHYPKCPAAALADIILLCGSQENPLHSGSVAAKMAQLFIIDVLFTEYCRMDMIHTNRNRETTSEALSNKLL